LKKVLFIFIVALINLSLSGQVVFAPKGANWYYSFNTHGYENYYWIPESIKYVGDSVVGVDTVKVLTHTRFYNNRNVLIASYRTLIKQKADTIYFMNSKTRGTWQILYNFSTPVGQFWQTVVDDDNGNPLQYFVTVDSIYFVTRNNLQLKELKVTYIGGKFGSEKTRITERYGCRDFMFNYDNPNYTQEFDRFGWFLCYRDDAFGVEKFTSIVCDFNNLLQIDNYYARQAKLQIFPNPAQDQVQIKIEGESVEDLVLYVCDISGRLVGVHKMHVGEALELKTSSYCSGLYLLRLENEGRILENKRMVIVR